MIHQRYINRLSKEGASELLREIVWELDNDKHLVEEGTWHNVINVTINYQDPFGTLTELVKSMNKLAMSDFFGSEGWEVRYNI